MKKSQYPEITKYAIVCFHDYEYRDGMISPKVTVVNSQEDAKREFRNEVDFYYQNRFYHSNNEKVMNPFGSNEALKMTQKLFGVERCVFIDIIGISINPEAEKQEYGFRRFVSLLEFSDKELKQELERRRAIRDAEEKPVLRCRDCKHCINGYTTARAWFRNETTAVCELKPKPKAGENCHYSTSHSNRACENFEPKCNENTIS